MLLKGSILWQIPNLLSGYALTFHSFLLITSHTCNENFHIWCRDWSVAFIFFFFFVSFCSITFSKMCFLSLHSSYHTLVSTSWIHMIFSAHYQSCFIISFYNTFLSTESWISFCEFSLINLLSKYLRWSLNLLKVGFILLPKDWQSINQ